MLYLTIIFFNRLEIRSLVEGEAHLHADNRINPAMRAGWTMIELIFILIVIGILAAVAIPRLMATRDDAKLSADVSSMAICIRDMGTLYTATNVSLPDINSTACNNIECYTIEVNGSQMRVDLNASGADYCNEIENVGGHLVKTYQFSGQTVTR
jgi:type II secretory pathway pseudopilin PulG